MTFARIELGNKIRNGRAIGNDYMVRGVEKFADGRTRTWTISHHDTIEAAEAARDKIMATPMEVL